MSPVYKHTHTHGYSYTAVWNSLSRRILKCDTLSTFKFKLKTFFFMLLDKSNLLQPVLSYDLKRNINLNITTIKYVNMPSVL